MRDLLFSRRQHVLNSLKPSRDSSGIFLNIIIIFFLFFCIRINVQFFHVGTVRFFFRLSETHKKVMSSLSARTLNSLLYYLSKKILLSTNYRILKCDYSTKIVQNKSVINFFFFRLNLSYITNCGDY